MEKIEELMTLKDVMQLVKLSRSTITRMLKAGKFPKPLEFSRKLYWKREQLDDFLKNLNERK
ncbi:MAG: helix-turn-helix domain-containing protein [Holosporaceae bacterium]|nr:helix-turn-helix domain-containing protein [Holosporaceae bacterium]